MVSAWSLVTATLLVVFFCTEARASSRALRCPAHSSSTCSALVCDRTCQPLTQASRCQFERRPGCVCDSGYVRHGNSCIADAECQRKLLPGRHSQEAKTLRETSERQLGCPPNFTATCTPSSCTFTCANHSLSSLLLVFCPPAKELTHPACICMTGFVRKGHRCVRSSDCPPKRPSEMDAHLHPGPQPTALPKQAVAGTGKPRIFEIPPEILRPTPDTVEIVTPKLTSRPTPSRQGATSTKGRSHTTSFPDDYWSSTWSLIPNLLSVVMVTIATCLLNR